MSLHVMRRHLVWRYAMMEEYQSIMKNDVCYITDGSIERHKTRFIAIGFSQVDGIDYEDTFVLVARNTSIWMIFSPVTSMSWRVHQMDVKTTFLNEEIKEEVYIEQPDGFVIHEKESHVCRLKMALYGIKKPPRAWYARIDGNLMIFGIQQKCCQF
jgi:hypothetical protein